MKNKTIQRKLQIICFCILCCLGVFATGKQVYAKDIVVVLDAGHGGYDGGASRSFSDLEKNYNLKLVKYCKEELEKYAGIKVYMTRSTDKFIELDKRCQIAKKYNADFFISFHCNANESSSVYGSEVYITQSNYQSFHSKTLKMANLVLDQLEQVGLTRRMPYARDNDWGEKYKFGGSADYYAVIRGCVKRKIPSMIIEHAFVSNRSDVSKFLSKESKLQQMGAADATAIAQYFNLASKVYPDEVTLNKNVLSLQVGQSASLKATLNPSGVKKDSLTYKSSNTGVVTVSPNGKVKAVAGGKAIVSVKTKNGRYDYCVVTVETPVQNLTLEQGHITLDIGNENGVCICTKINPANADNKELTYSTSNSAIATVTSYGFVRGVKEGTATITVKSKNGKTATCIVTVQKPVERIQPGQKWISLNISEQKELSIQVLPSDATDHTWKAETKDTDIIEISQSDSQLLITGKQEGYAVITVSAASQVTEKIMVKVTASEAEEPVVLEKIQIEPVEGQKETGIELTAEEPDIQYQIPEAYAAILSLQDNRLLGLSEGYGFVEAYAGEKLVKSYYVEIEKKQVLVQAVNSNATSVTVKVGESLPLTYSLLPENATNRKLSFVSSNTSVATVKDGKVTGVSNGTARVIAQTTSGAKHRRTFLVKVTTPVTSVTMARTKITMNAGNTMKLAGFVNPYQASIQNLTYSTSKASVATVTSKGVVTAKKAGTALITLTSTDGRKQAECIITVLPKATKVTLRVPKAGNQSRIYMKKGSSRTLKATVSPTKAQQAILWKSSNKNVTVTSKGVIKAKRVGMAIITASNRDETQLKTITVVVTKKAKRAKKIQFAAKSYQVSVGKTVKLKTVVTPKETTNTIKYTSLNKAVAKVDSYGTVTGVKTGTAKIQVKTSSGKTATCTVKVKE